MHSLQSRQSFMLMDEFTHSLGMPDARTGDVGTEPSEAPDIPRELGQPPGIRGSPVPFGLEPGELCDVAGPELACAGQAGQEVWTISAGVDPAVDGKRSLPECDLDGYATLVVGTDFFHEQFPRLAGKPVAIPSSAERPRAPRATTLGSRP